MMFTIFTPAYNRASLLPRLYQSLIEQTSYDFEWLIVDDGSTDNTAEVVQPFIENGHFPVRYLKKENGGKHTAYNLALQEAQGAWFLCVDSDDFLAASAVKDLCDFIRPDMTGVATYKTDLLGNSLCDSFPSDLDSVQFHRLALEYGCRGEFALAFSTKFAARFPFPIFSGERFMSESIIYDRMDQAHEMHLLPKVTTLCEYQPGGLSMNFSALMGKNPNGFCLYFMQRIDLQPKLLPRMIHAGKYHAFHMICKNKDLRYTGPHRFLVACAIPLGLLFRLYYKLFRNI